MSQPDTEQARAPVVYRELDATGVEFSELRHDSRDLWSQYDNSVRSSAKVLANRAALLLPNPLKSCRTGPDNMVLIFRTCLTTGDKGILRLRTEEGEKYTTHDLRCQHAVADWRFDRMFVLPADSITLGLIPTKSAALQELERARRAAQGGDPARPRDFTITVETPIPGWPAGLIKPGQVLLWDQINVMGVVRPSRAETLDFGLQVHVYDDTSHTTAAEETSGPADPGSRTSSTMTGSITVRLSVKKPPPPGGPAPSDSSVPQWMGTEIDLKQRFSADTAMGDPASTRYVLRLREPWRLGGRGEWVSGLVLDLSCGSLISTGAVPDGH